MAAERSISDIDWLALRQRTFTPSPESWEDQVMYFVMIDRFSDGNERDYIDNNGNPVTTGVTPVFSPSQKNSILVNEKFAAAWREAGDTFCGGTIAGLQSKLGYLQRLGITTLWLSPVLKQAVYDKTTYHGYGTQNFLEIDPHFGTKEQLRSLVDEAHKLKMLVVLDIIVNHTGNVFTYDASDQSAIVGPAFNNQGSYPVIGFNDESGNPTITFGPLDSTAQQHAWPDGAVWPHELQSESTFNRRGAIDNYEDEDQFLHGDFMKLKDVNLGTTDAQGFHPSVALQTLTAAYQYWIAYADLDGFRIDAVKHMEQNAVTYFFSQIREFAQQLGKKNFYQIGEVAGGRTRAASVMHNTGLHAVLAVDDSPGTLEKVVKGQANPLDYFSFFSSVKTPDKWLGKSVITMYDDHDQIRNGYAKARFAAGDDRWTRLASNALSMLVTTMGIPGIYYGSEQSFDGEGGDDNYIREAMFGGSFGPFRSTGGHCFNERSNTYECLSRLLSFRKVSNALRRGDQMLFQTSGDGTHYDYPHMISGHLNGVICWLRSYESEVLLCAMNTDIETVHTIFFNTEEVGSDANWQCRYSSNPNQEKSIFQGNKVIVPAAGFVIFQRI